MTFTKKISRNSDWDENDNDFIASDGSVQHSSSGSNNSDSSDALGGFYRFVFLIGCPLAIYPLRLYRTVHI